MTCLDITTDHKWRPFKYDYEVPTKVLEDKYEHLKTDEGYEPDGYFKYRNNWYHLSDFATMPERDVTEKWPWQACHADGFFSGVLIEVSKDGEEYRVATYTN